jgi:hypothetical protein
MFLLALEFCLEVSISTLIKASIIRLTINPVNNKVLQELLGIHNLRRRKQRRCLILENAVLFPVVHAMADQQPRMLSAAVPALGVPEGGSGPPRIRVSAEESKALVFDAVVSVLVDLPDIRWCGDVELCTTEESQVVHIKEAGHQWHNVRGRVTSLNEAPFCADLVGPGDGTVVLERRDVFEVGGIDGAEVLVLGAIGAAPGAKRSYVEPAYSIESNILRQSVGAISCGRHNISDGGAEVLRGRNCCNVVAVLEQRVGVLFWVPVCALKSIDTSQQVRKVAVVGDASDAKNILERLDLRGVACS